MAAEGFDIKYKDVLDVVNAYKNNLVNLITKLEDMEGAINTFVNNSTFEGESATAIKSYFLDVHGTMVCSLKVTAQNLLDNIALYKASLWEIDSSTNFRLNEEAIGEYRKKLYGRYESVYEDDGPVTVIKDQLKKLENEDLYSCRYPTEKQTELACEHEAVNNRLKTYIEDITTLEINTVEAMENTTDVLIRQLKAVNKKIGVDWDKIKEYKPNSIYQDGDVYALSYASQLIYEQHESLEDIYEDIWEMEDKLEEMADERETAGIWKTVGGAAMIVTGTVAIIASAGAATPVVVAAVTAGGGTVVFGTADAVEGMQDVYYGEIGDIDSASLNEIKSIVYAAGGDDKTYSLLENVFAFASSAMIPIGTAGKAGELTFRSGIVMLGKEGVSTLAGYGASNLVYDKTNNQTLGMIAGILASMGSAKGLNMADAKLGWSNKGVKGNVVESVTGDIESGSKTPSEIARSWQGTGKYPGIDDYVDITVEKGTVLYRGEPNGTEYFTTLDAIEQSGRDATKLFEGLQVEKNPIHGYRGEMQGYIFNEDVASAYGITNANPQFGKGGLPQYYVPDVQDLIDKGILTPVDNIKLNK